MSTKDYTSIYSIKDFVKKDIAPKYFDVDDINALNVGLMGYSTEVMATTTEDVFNSISTYTREFFANIAQMPETLYSNAAMLNIENLFAQPSELVTVLFVNENDIITKGKPKIDKYEFVLDADLIMDVEGKQFMMDYDVIITAKPYGTDHIFTAQYDFSFKNALSSLANPYIKTKRVRLNNTNYLGIIVTMHQVNRYKQTEYIINNDKINLPSITFDYVDQLANFEVFYKAPDALEYTQLKKKLVNSPPLKEPFCFYRIKDENTVELSFTIRDNYFQPEFNSELLIHTYTTNGAKGNFPVYQGNNVTVTPKSNEYDYNNGIVVYAVPQTASQYGQDSLSLDGLRAAIVEKSSTSGAYNIENDLQLYFSNYKYKDNNEVLFVKKRDDALERLFSAFALFKDKENDFYQTNTLNVDFYQPDFDLEYEQTNKFVLKAGRLFKYNSDATDLARVIPDISLKDDLSKINEPFLYTNPFLITVAKNPSIVGFYLNSVDDKIPLEYKFVNNESLVQFMCNNVTIKRNALLGEDDYVVEITVSPTTDLVTPIVDANGVDTGNLKIILAVEDGTSDSCFINFKFASYDAALKSYTFRATLTTDDYMTFGQKMRVYDVRNMVDGEKEVKLIPMSNTILNIYTLFKYPNLQMPHPYDFLPEFADHTLTNIYTTSDIKANFITPMDIMRSRVKYKPLPNDDYYMSVTFLPLVEASSMKNFTQYSYFMTLLYQQYSYLLGAIDKITNNYGIDLKFYNTFGRSKNFVVGEDGTKLDHVNIKIHFKVAPNIGVIEDDLIRDLKIFIKNYVEGINNKGYNAIYISNLIQSIENSFDDVKYLKFVNINNYDSSVQVIENRGLNINLLTKEERMDYVPEYLTLGLDDVIIDIIR